MKKPSDIYDELKDSIVILNLIGFNNENVGLASGVIIRKTKDICYIIINHHLLKANFEKIEFEHRGIRISDDDIEILNADEDLDLLLLLVKGYGYNPIQEIGNSDKLLIGELVYAIGSPLDLENTFSNGIISGLRIAGKNPRIQTTAPIAGGSSGGALVNESGSLIGITVEGYDVGNLNFAIPINIVMKFIEESINNLIDNKYSHNFYIGMNAFKIKRYDYAKDYFTKCEIITDKIKKADIFYFKGLCHYKISEMDLAIECFTKSINLFPFSNYYIDRGRCYQEKNDYANALKDYSSSIKLDKFNLRAQVNKAIVLFKSGEYDRVKKILMFILDQNEESKNKADAHLILGVLYRKEKQFLESVEQLNKAIKIFKENLIDDPDEKDFGCEYFFELALTSFYQRKYLDVIKNLEEVTNLLPNNPLPYLLNGICYWKFKSFDYAIFNFEECELKYKDFNYENNYKSILEDNAPFNLDIHPKLGIADSYYRTSEVDEAISILDDLLENHPNFVEAFITKAQIFLRNNNLSEALKNFELALKHFNKSERFLFYSDFDKNRIENEILKIKKILNG